MLDKDMRATILNLHRQGHGRHAIAQSLKISRNSVKAVIKSGSPESKPEWRASRLSDRREEIRGLHDQCAGNLVRVREKLRDGGLAVSYSTLTWFCREQGIGRQEKIPVRRILTGPGEEMQHDTSPYVIVIGGKKVKRQCASLVLGYSRMIFIWFYPRFDRFHCKVFLTEAYQYFEGV